MKRDGVLRMLAANRENLDRFSVKSIAIFGSMARDEALPGSDIDLLVEFSEPIGLFDFIRLKNHLEELLQTPVDLVTPDALKDRMREKILREAIRAA